jgi:prepilin-type N-terminal cleavage/methylation domain-containing protein
LKRDQGVKALNKRGFSLIEVVIGLVILAVAILSILGMQIVSVRGNFFSRYLTQATYVAQDGLEVLDSLPLSSPGLQAGSYNDGMTRIAGIDFNRSYTVAADASGMVINYTVRWVDGVDRSITFSTVR